MAEAKVAMGVTAAGDPVPIKVTSEGRPVFSTGSSAYPEATNFAALPDATIHTGEIYVVLNPTGTIWLATKKKAGQYIGDGGSPTDWRYLGIQRENFNDALANFFNDTDNTKTVGIDVSTQPTATKGFLAIKSGEVGGSTFNGGVATTETLTLKANPVDEPAIVIDTECINLGDGSATQICILPDGQPFSDKMFLGTGSFLIKTNSSRMFEVQARSASQIARMKVSDAAARSLELIRVGASFVGDVLTGGLGANSSAINDDHTSGIGLSIGVRNVAVVNFEPTQTVLNPNADDRDLIVNKQTSGEAVNYIASTDLLTLDPAQTVVGPDGQTWGASVGLAVGDGNLTVQSFQSTLFELHARSTTQLSRSFYAESRGASRALEIAKAGTGFVGDITIGGLGALSSAVNDNASDSTGLQIGVRDISKVNFEPDRTNFKERINVPIVVFNDTGVTITKGKMVNASGVDATNSILEVVLADNSSPNTSLSVLGMTTEDILDGTTGLVNSYGEVRDIDTSGLSIGGPLYLSTSGNVTQTRPVFPDTILFVGSVIEVNASTGRVQIEIARFRRRSASRSYGFTSQGIASGTFYKGGFYDWSTVDANLTQASTTVTHGTAGTTYAAHPGIVPSGAGTVDTGVVGLRVTGTLDSETGNQVASQSETISGDITTLTANVLAEAVGKFSGQVTFELFVVSGAPTTFSLDFNYGYSKFEDFQNRNATITAFEAVWQGNAADTGFDIALLHHKTTGWTYAATGFAPGNGDIVRRSVRQAIDSNVTSGLDGSWKSIDIDQFINGNTTEGVIVEIITTNNSTIQTMDIHVAAVSEEITN